MESFEVGPCCAAVTVQVEEETIGRFLSAANSALRTAAAARKSLSVVSCHLPIGPETYRSSLTRGEDAGNVL
jgi:hypothetical protein